MKKIDYILKNDSFSKDLYYVYIEGDVNDGDYITEETIYTKKEFELILPLLKDMWDNYSDNGRLERWVSCRDDYDYLCELGYSDVEIEKVLSINFGDIVNIPSSEWGYAHTLVDLNMYMINKDGVKYNIYFED